jgi:hypothetical protein
LAGLASAQKASSDSAGVFDTVTFMTQDAPVGVC